MLNHRPCPVKHRIDPKLGPATAGAGHLLVLEALRRTGLFVGLPNADDRSQGWTDSQMLTTLVLLNAAGHDRVADVGRLEGDEGLRAVVARMEPQIAGLPGRRIAGRFRRGRGRTFPSDRSIHDWLERFHHAGAEGLGTFDEILRRIAGYGFAASGSTSATIDLDATIVRSFKKGCEYTYRAANGDVPGERGFQPLIAFCPEIGMVLHSEMRDGNVPASKGNLEALAAVLGRLPRSVERAMVRTDGAGYQERIIRFCNDPSVRPEPLRRFGTVAMVAGAPRTKALMEEVDRLPEDAWRPLPADGEACRLEVAELGFVPNIGARQGASHVMRFVATRRELPGELGVDPGDIPAAGGRPAYRLRCCFTNIPAPDATPAELANGLGPRTAAGIVRLAHGRCGQGEAVHSMLKSDLAAGILPSGRLGANAAWLKAAAVTLNVIALLRTVSMGGGWLRARMKRIRAVWIHHVGMVSRRGRRTTLVLPPAARHVASALDRLARPQAPP